MGNSKMLFTGWINLIKFKMWVLFGKTIKKNVNTKEFEGVRKMRNWEISEAYFFRLPTYIHLDYKTAEI